MTQAKKKTVKFSRGPLSEAERRGREICEQLDAHDRSCLGQYLTPAPLATFLAQMFSSMPDHVRLLDPGAGAGTLSAAFLQEVLTRERRPRSIELHAWEVDGNFIPALTTVLKKCVDAGRRIGTEVSYYVTHGDFLDDAVTRLSPPDLFSGERKPVEFTHAILNPPYRKINTDSEARRKLRQAGLETSNLYTGFLWLAAKLLGSNGEMVAITPRSFSNGPYFLPFRERFFGEMALQRVHVFDRRDKMFSADDVLQENVIMHARRSAPRASVTVSSSPGIEPQTIRSRSVGYSEVIDSRDGRHVLHLTLNRSDDAVKERMKRLGASLRDLGIGVSTGRVVDFRAKEFLRDDPGKGTVPLIYPSHFNGGKVHWPKPESRKPNALIADHATEDLLVPNGVYVLVKRFTAKEEKRRVVAIVFSPDGQLRDFDSVGFENHLNYFHSLGRPLDESLAKGLAVFLNSSLVDTYFRQFSGHTQVNATDLRSLRYPSKATLRRLSEELGDEAPDQATIDARLESLL